jgi:formyltetrahydrofolate hydrolase
MYINTGNKKQKKVKSRFKHVLHDIIKKYSKHNYNIMIETVLTIKKNCRQFVWGKPLFWPQFDHTSTHKTQHNHDIIGKVHSRVNKINFWKN